MVTSTYREAEAVTEELQSLLPPDQVAYYPAWETLPHERLSPRSDTVGRRLAVLRRLVHPEPDAEPLKIIVAPVRSVLQPQVKGLADLAPVSLPSATRSICTPWPRGWSAAAYVRVDLVERRGEFAVRGGIVDVFPPTEEHPVRVDFFGDEVDEIRHFSVADQRSGEETLPSFIASPCRELLLTEDGAGQGRRAGPGSSRTGRDVRADRPGPRGRGDGVAVAGAGGRDGAAGRVDAGRRARPGQRPRAGPRPGHRSGHHQPGVPGGVLGRGGRRGPGSDRPG